MGIKIILNMYLSLKILFNNKIRFWLTVIGTTLGLFLVALGIEVANTYIEKEYKKMYSMSNNLYMISSEKSIDITDVLYKLKKNDCGFSYSYFKAARDLGNVKKMYKKSVISSNLRLVGASYSFENNYFYYETESGKNFEHLQFIMGKGFSKRECEKKLPVCVIEKSTSEILFGTHESIGQEILITIADVDYSFKIVGVIDDLSTTKEDNLKINSSFRFENDILIERNIIVPLRWYNEFYLNNERTASYVVFKLKSNNLEMSKGILQTANYNTDNTEHIDYSVLLHKYNDEMKIVEVTLNYILILVLFFSGLIVMNTLFFSVKERIVEFGIRRSIGASSRAILIQLLFESVVLGLISYITTILFCKILFTTFSLVSVFILGKNWIIYLRIKTCIFLCILSLTESILFSFIPALYAIRVKPTEAMVFN